MIGLRAEQLARDARVFLRAGPPEHDEAGLRLLLDDLVDEGGRKHDLRVAVRQERVVMAGALDHDVELHLALRGQRGRAALLAVLGGEPRDECGESDVFLEGGERADLAQRYRQIMEWQLGQIGIMPIALFATFSDIFLEMEAIKH